MSLHLARSRRSRGFTLVELMVSLVAGLIIAVAVVGLAKASTVAFHEQVRLTSVEQSVRNAANRLRYDLTKVSFMGTGNIRLASTGTNVPYGHRVAVNGNGVAGDRYVGRTTDLQGIRIYVKGSAVGGPVADGAVAGYGAAPNFTVPDAIDISGNLTTDDQYIGSWNPTGGGCTGGQITLKASADPANERLISGNAANVTNAFTPGPANTVYLARVVDDGGCQHFVEVRNATATNAADPINGIATIDLCAGSDSTSVLYAHLPDPTDVRLAGPKGTGCGVDPLGNVRISPYHRVRYRVSTPPAALEAALAPPTAIAPTGSSFFLFRDVLDSQGNAVPNLTQIVAEYAVDLKFGIAVDDRTNAPPNNIRVFDLDSDTAGVGGGGNIDSWTKPASTTVTNGPGPQRVRSVKFRVSTRTAIPDRDKPLTIIPSSPYITRYCLDLPGCTKFARVRSVVSEVPLINQARMTY